MLPFALDRKFPNAATEWRWQFVFPAGRICRDPRFGPPSRYHLHESVVQKALVQAVRPAGITKRVGPHTLRHYAGSRTMPSDRKSGSESPDDDACHRERDSRSLGIVSWSYRLFRKASSLSSGR